MNANTLTGTVVGLAVVIILVASLFMPVYSEYTNAEKTYMNEGDYFTAPDGESHTLVFTTGAVAVDDVSIDFPEGYNGQATVMLGDDWMLRLDRTLTRLVLAGPDNEWVVLGYVADGITLSISDTTLTYTVSDVEYTRDNVQYYLAPEGDMVMCSNPYITSTTEMIGGIRNSDNDTGADIFEIVSGSIEDGFTELICRATLSDSSTTTFTSTFTSNTETIDGSLLQLTSIVQDITLEDEETTGTITISYLLVPETITYDDPKYLGDANASILSVLPILLVCGIMIAVVGIVASGRRD